VTGNHPARVMRPRPWEGESGRVDTPARIVWLGHSTVLLELGGVRLLTDPVLRNRVAHLRRHGAAPEVPGQVDAVLLSHLHYDHLDLASLRLLPGDVGVLAPAGAGALLRGAGVADVEELVPGQVAEVGGLRVEATPAYHDERRRPLGARATPLGFVVRGRHTVYFAGDTDMFPGMADLAPVDVALLPVAGWGPKLGPGHMDAGHAAQAAALLRPAVAVPIHWGTLHPRGRRRGSWFDDPPHEFAARVAEVAPDVEVRILSPGGVLEL
jgi:L-ascorbate metabolism protein UlaG (beta-lactamase superfamily)